jgi:predicted MPP superfamily phosphohydrolase
MTLITRRTFLRGAGAGAIAAGGLGGYAMGIEPGLMLDVTPYAPNLPRWPESLPLRIAVIADVHACEPWMSAARIRDICLGVNGLKPDITVLLGDFTAGHNMVSAPVMPDGWGEALSVLRAPLGVFSVLGNHDWWHGALPRMRGDEGESVRKALKAANIKVLENDAVRLEKNGQPFWVLGLADQMAIRVRRGHFKGMHDLNATLRQVTDDAPALLLAHEPFIFEHVPERIALTLCGHTHGGQVQIPFMDSPATRRVRADWVYGHVINDNRHMIVSAGLGTSIFPIRFMRPPEIVDIKLGTQALV